MRFLLLFYNMMKSSIRYYWLRLDEIRGIVFGKTRSKLYNTAVTNKQLSTRIIMAVIKTKKRTTRLLLLSGNGMTSVTRYVW